MIKVNKFSNVQCFCLSRPICSKINFSRREINCGYLFVFGGLRSCFSKANHFSSTPLISSGYCCVLLSLKETLKNVFNSCSYWCFKVKISAVQVREYGLEGFRPHNRPTHVFVYFVLKCFLFGFHYKQNFNFLRCYHKHNITSPASEPKRLSELPHTGSYPLVEISLPNFIGLYNAAWKPVLKAY